jgi:hypothetical protein
MSDQPRITVTLHWRDGEEGWQQRQVAFVDQTPQQLIPRLVEALELPQVDQEGERMVYELRAGGEQRPALQPRELLSGQDVRTGMDIWLAAREVGFDAQLRQRCILRLPDDTELVIGPRGQVLNRLWLLEFLKLHNPDEYRREEQRSLQRRSPFMAVTRDDHCSIRLAEQGFWIATTERSDVLTEWAVEQDFEPLPLGAPIRLDNGMRLRLGGAEGLEVVVILV